MSVNREKLPKSGANNPKSASGRTEPDIQRGLSAFNAGTQQELRQLNQIARLEREVEKLKALVGTKTRRYLDVIYRLESLGDVRWCEDCDEVYSFGGQCNCAEDNDNSGLTNSERNR